MTVYVVMPVFNRLALTKQMLNCLSVQKTDETVKLVVVDDGSTDGTHEFLLEVPDLTLLHGDGSLWWGGAVDLALRYIYPLAQNDDWVLLVNNDTEVRPDFLQSLLDTANRFPKSIVGSVVRDRANGKLLSVGPVIDASRFRVRDCLDVYEMHFDLHEKGGVRNVDALSGRGLLIPVAALQAAGGMRPRWLPHYLADYELSVRLKSKDWELLVALNVPVYSDKHFGSSYKATNFLEKYRSIRSPSYLPAVLAFWWGISSWPQRLTLPFRLLFLCFFPKLRK